MAFLLGGAVIGATATAIVSDSDDASSRVATPAAGVTEHGYAYSHGFSYAPDNTHVSADAAERRALSEQWPDDSCLDIPRGAC
jgi:hypothetical protein